MTGFDHGRAWEAVKEAGLDDVVSCIPTRRPDGRYQLQVQVGIAGAVLKSESLPPTATRADFDAATKRVVARAAALTAQYGLASARRYSDIAITFQPPGHFPAMREELLDAARSSNADLVAALSRWLAVAAPDLRPTTFALIGKYGGASKETGAT